MGCDCVLEWKKKENTLAEEQNEIYLNISKIKMSDFYFIFYQI